jgi:glucose-6-phosphate isomerase
MTLDRPQTTTVDVPTRLDITPDGLMIGATGRYEKRLGDLDGLYRDDDAFRALVDERGADALVYSVCEHRYRSEPGALIIGTSTLLPGQVGEEYAMTRGHLHAVSDRAEMYHCLSGHGVMLLDTVDGESVAVELRAGQAVDVPGHWVHRSVNVGDEPFVTLFCYGADAGQDYDLIERAGGMKTLIVRDGDGWAQVPNPTHVGYTETER